MTTIAVIAAAPGRMLQPLVAACGALAPTAWWTPFASPAWLRQLPGAVGAFARRRLPERTQRAPHGPERASPWLFALDAGLSAWAGARTDRRYRAEWLRRLAIDAWSAREVERRRPRVVIACSLAARATFAAARSIGARCVLVLDVPLLRVLHRDLDRAAAAWPDREFLRRYRAPGWAIARQEAERVLADLVLVRGAYARAACVADGVTRLAALPRPPATPSIAPLARGSRRRLRLAGLAAARTGIDTALAVARALDAILVVRTGEGTEPRDLLAHPDVTVDGPADAIICPAICETYAPELDGTGLPIIASPMASADGTGPDPYDVHAFAAAVAAADPTAVASTSGFSSDLAPVLASLVRAGAP